MELKKANNEELKELVPIFKEFFPVHAIFTKSDEEIMQYLSDFKGDILIAHKDSKVIGGIAIERKHYGHVLALFKHIASKGGSKKIVKEMVQEAEKIANAGKIEIHIAEGEKIAHGFFKRSGYKLEGKLRAHYRPNEICYILGKVI
jgi:RimJ/RimL family protein N-acetyltransferase